MIETPDELLARLQRHRWICQTKEREWNQELVDRLMRIVPRLRDDQQLQTDIITHGLKVVPCPMMMDLTVVYFMRIPEPKFVLGGAIGRRCGEPRFKGPVQLLVPTAFYNVNKEG